MASKLSSYKFLHQFLILKLLVFIVAHVSVLTVPANNSAADLILFHSPNLNSFDWFLKVLLRPFIRWDAIHMLVISTHWYLFENQFAFFPLLPMVSRYLGIGLSEYCEFNKFVSIEPLMALIGIIFSNTCHYLASLILYKLTLFIFNSRKFARITALLFIFNAATVQLSTMYTEAPFALFTFAGLYSFCKGYHFIASVIWAFGSATRSNGIVLIGFFFHDLLMTLVSKEKCLRNILIKSFKTIIYSLISVSSFLAFQYYAYSIYCYREPPTRPWCNYRLPNIYSFVQKEYWHVGLFKYYTLNNIPNFLFATPMIIISAAACYLYFESDHLRFLSLGLIKSNNKKLKLFYDNRVLPHIYLLLFMLLYNLFIAHVQIITRLFTFMPVIYWFMSYLIINSSVRIKEMLLTYTGLYGLLVAALFSLNYPPA